MPYQLRIITAIQRTALVLLCLSLAGANTLAGANYPRARSTDHGSTLETRALHSAHHDAEEARLAAETRGCK